MPFDNLHSGDVYDPNDNDIMSEQLKCLEKLYARAVNPPAVFGSFAFSGHRPI